MDKNVVLEMSDNKVVRLSGYMKQRAVRAPQNDHVANGMIAAARAVLDLVDRGFTVLGVMIGGPKPAIRIQNSMKCADLNGVSFRRRATNGAREDTMVAIVSGCQVQWTELGH